MSKDNASNILLIALALCLVCSVVVSTAAISLKPRQELNRALDQKINILKVSGLWRDNHDVDELFSSIESRIVNLETGDYVEQFDVANYDQRKAAKDTRLSIELSKEVDIAGINRRANFAKIYLVKEGNDVHRIVLPMHGYGLWSTLYGYVTLEKDMNTIYALTFYDHRETPGLGGEVDNSKWQSSWQGKKLFNQQGDIAIEVMKGNVVEGNPFAIHQVDGLSGATLTSNGVTNMFRFWIGEHGFKAYIDKVRRKGDV